MNKPLPSPKSRLGAVYGVPEDEPQRQQRVTYQLEDTGHPTLRLRPTLRLVEEDGATRYLYRVDAFSRMTGIKLGSAELLAPLGSPEEFASESRQFQSAPFRAVVEGLSSELTQRYAEAEAVSPPPA